MCYFFYFFTRAQHVSNWYSGIFSAKSCKLTIAIFLFMYHKYYCKLLAQNSRSVWNVKEPRNKENRTVHCTHHTCVTMNNIRFMWLLSHATKLATGWCALQVLTISCVFDGCALLLLKCSRVALLLYALRSFPPLQSDWNTAAGIAVLLQNIFWPTKFVWRCFFQIAHTKRYMHTVLTECCNYWT